MKNYQYDKTPINLTKEEYISIASGNTSTLNKDVMARILLKECKYLFHTIKSSQQVPEELRLGIINDTAANVLYKMEQGKVPHQSYDLYKNYLFMSLMNATYQLLDKRQRERKVIQFNSELYDSISGTDYEQRIEDTHSTLLQDLECHLTSYERKILQYILLGYKLVEIAKLEGTGKGQNNFIIKNLKKKIEHTFINGKRPYQPRVYQPDEAKEIEMKIKLRKIYKNKQKE